MTSRGINKEGVPRATVQLSRKGTDTGKVGQLILGRYRIQRRVNQGGTATIFAALDERLNRRVAVKILGGIEQGSAVEQRLRSEAEVMASLHHHGVPPVYDKGFDCQQIPFIVMKFVDGKNLDDLLREGKMTRSSLIQVLCDVCNTMAYAHSQNVIHLDLKPENIMVGGFGRIFVLDWGLARRLGHDAQDDTDGLVMGTPSYMAPEQATGGPTDQRTDVFGLGAILFEVLTGHPPLEHRKGETTDSQVERASQGLPMNRLQLLEECDGHPVLIRLARSCLHPDPARRPPNAIAVAKTLTSLQHAVFETGRTDLERFFELSLDIMCIAGMDGYYRRMNQNFSKVLGYSEDVLLDSPILSFIEEDDHEATLKAMESLSAGKPVRYRNRFRAADGHIVLLEWTAQSIPEIKLIFAVARDMTPFFPVRKRP